MIVLFFTVTLTLSILVVVKRPATALAIRKIKKDDIIIEMQNESISSTGDILKVIERVISQGKENVLIVFYAGPNSRKYIGARLSID